MGRVMILGLDGATFDLIHPWAAQGRLPRLQALMTQGVAGELRSTTPPMSPPAWSSFMTGVNPGKHGIFDFTERKPGAYEIQFVSSQDRKAETVWKTLSRAGKRVCVIGVPTTYPVEAVNGVMISGFDAPAMTDRAIYPAGLYAEIKEKVGEYIISPNIMKDVDDGHTDLAVDALLHSIDRKADIARYLWKREAWDCFMVVFGETDKVVHHFWKHHDPRSPHHQPLGPASRYPDPVLAVYERLDAVVGGFADLCTSDTTLMVVSDHGTGGSSDKVIYVNAWLAANGYLGFREASGGSPLSRLRTRLSEVITSKILSKAKVWGRRLLSPRIRKNLRYRSQGLAPRFESMLRFAAIDWRATKAYSEETSFYPGIWINLKGREPDGTVEAGAEYEALRDALIEKLRGWRDPETGAPVVKQVWRREEVYRGPHLTGAVDLVIDWALDRGYAYLSRPSYTSKDKQPIRRLDLTESGISKYMMSRSGSHRDQGILIIKGSSVAPGTTLRGAEIIDMAPTILSLAGVPVPSGLDGRVLTETPRS
jgi:predicted AlkP superfamily phosphohydrolase/phosphomutase